MLVGGESKVGSTEDEGISGGLGLDMIEVKLQNTATLISASTVTTTNPDTIPKCNSHTDLVIYGPKLIPSYTPQCIVVVSHNYYRYSSRRL